VWEEIRRLDSKIRKVSARDNRRRQGNKANRSQSEKSAPIREQLLGLIPQHINESGKRLGATKYVEKFRKQLKSPEGGRIPSDRTLRRMVSELLKIL